MKDIMEASKRFDEAKECFKKQTVSGSKPTTFTKAELKKQVGDMDEEVFEKLFGMAFAAGIIDKAGKKWRFS